EPLGNLCTSQFRIPSFHGVGIGIGIGIDPVHAVFLATSRPDSETDSGPDQAVELPVQRFLRRVAGHRLLVAGISEQRSISGPYRSCRLRTPSRVVRSLQPPVFPTSD